MFTGVTQAASQDYGHAVRRATSVIEAHREELNVPGMQIAISIGGRMVLSRGFGWADLENLVPVSPLTRFRIGSVSKALTSAAVAKLVENGKLDLDAPISDYISSFPEKRWQLTARQLGGHLGGVRHYTNRSEGTNSHPYVSVTEALGVFKNDSLLFEPGTRMHYSSYGFNLLSAVLEGASGIDFPTLLIDSVFSPLGMHSTGPDFTADIMPHRSSFYTRGRDGQRVNAPYDDLSVKWAGGGMVSTAEDLVRFGQAMLVARTSVEAAALLFESQRTIDGLATGYGIGWQITTDAAGRTLYSHSGNLASARAHLLIYPESEMVVAILANTGDGIFFNEGEAQEIAGFFFGPEGHGKPSSNRDWVGTWVIEMEDLRADTLVTSLLHLAIAGPDLKGTLTIPGVRNGTALPIPVAVGTQSRLRATVILGSHLNVELQRQEGVIAGQWNWLSTPLPPGLQVSLSPQQMAAMNERRRPREIRSVRRLELSRITTQSTPGNAGQPAEDQGFPVGRYDFEAEFQGSNLVGTIEIQGGPASYSGQIETPRRPPLTIESVEVVENRLTIATLRGLNFILNFVGDSFEGTISVGSDQFPIRGNKVR